jgi:hypothetical protein
MERLLIAISLVCIAIGLGELIFSVPLFFEWDPGGN